jgi:hypothetical protein
VQDLISPKSGDRTLQYSGNARSVHSSKVYEPMGKLGFGKSGREFICIQYFILKKYTR